jgi:hypothetical protein
MDAKAGSQNNMKKAEYRRLKLNFCGSEGLHSVGQILLKQQNS